MATYTLENDNRLVLKLQAETDAPTFLNLTNHTYWNLAGESSGAVYDQLLSLNPDRYTPVDEALVPTGEILTVSETPLDFRQPRAIGERIRDGHPQMVIAHGYDHNWVLNRGRASSLVLAATVVDPKSGRALKVYSLSLMPTKVVGSKYWAKVIPVKRGGSRGPCGSKLQSQNRH